MPRKLFDAKLIHNKTGAEELYFPLFSQDTCLMIDVKGGNYKSSIQGGPEWELKFREIPIVYGDIMIRKNEAEYTHRRGAGKYLKTRTKTPEIIDIGKALKIHKGDKIIFEKYSILFE